MDRENLETMYGGRITNDEKSTVSMYIGIGIGVLLVAVVIYFVAVGVKAKSEITGFDPNRPIPTDALLKKRLKPEEFAVVRENHNQIGFQNEFWNNERTGIYVDVITGEPLFTSVTKFDGGFGQPTFSAPISKDLLSESLDTSHGMQRVEVRAKRSNAHLGYRFPDPKSPTGEQYSMNSGAFHFIPVEQMKAKSYEAFLPLLEKK